MDVFFKVGWLGALAMGGLVHGSGGDAWAAAVPASWELVASPQAGWPQWRGPRRDGISDETGLLETWPDGGPVVLWETRGFGRGYSAPVITGGRLYLTGDMGENLVILALDLQGRTVWRATNGAAWKGPYPGARACVAVRDGRLFHMNAHGRVLCLDSATGREMWALNVLERFGGKNITWGLSECLLVDGERVIVTPGGTQALMAALHVGSGKTVWQSEPLRLGASSLPRHERVAEPSGETDSPGYASPILLLQGEHRLVVSCSMRHAFGVDAATGRLEWTRSLRTKYDVIAAAPVLVGGGVFVTAPDAGGGRLYWLHLTDGGVVPETAWTTLLDTCHGGVVSIQGAIFGSWYRTRKGWASLDAATGVVRYERNDLAKGSLLYADGRLYCLTEDGEMHLWGRGATRFEERGRFMLTSGRVSDAWAHPVILDGRLYLRFHERLVCYDIRSKRIEH